MKRVTEKIVAQWLGPKWRMRLVILIFLLAVFAYIAIVGLPR